MAIGEHQSSAAKGETWLTPPYILEALGAFDLDPCASVDQPWPTATKHYTLKDNGLAHEWRGRVWLNPPYGPKTGIWLHRMAHHGNGIVLVFARTETQMFFDSVWGKAAAVFFLEGRLHFHFANGTKAPANSGAPSVLIAYGENNAQVLEKCGLPGYFVRISENPTN